jgi:hypothetical protein
MPVESGTAPGFAFARLRADDVTEIRLTDDGESGDAAQAMDDRTDRLIARPNPAMLEDRRTRPGW